MAMLLACALVLTGCGATDPAGESRAEDGAPRTAQPEPGGGEDGPGGEAEPAAYAVEPPGPLRESLLTADVLITGQETLPARVVRGVRRIDGVTAVLPLSLASASIDGRTLNVAAVDPGEFRRFTPVQSAQADSVWERLAGGEVAVDNAVDRKLIGKGDMMRLSTRDDVPAVHVGAYAPLVQQTGAGWDKRPWVHAVVNPLRGEQLGMPEGNALLVSTGDRTPSSLREQFERVVGDDAALQTLALEFDVTATQTAVLTGASVSQAVGTFSYTNRPNGEIAPDPAWVQEYIRTEEVPILGKVTCNKAYLPQLRAALEEVVREGLADKINPDEYAGCYYPRYIGRDPSNGLSLHSWGIAVDLNVPGNLRGTVGEIDRRVVAIFKKWGMAWGGDWSYTDPMHFEMNAVVHPGG
jgi:hypothetical protein